MNKQVKRVLVWLIGALILLSLSDILPNAVVWLMVILITGVLLTNGDTYVNGLNDAIKNIQS